MRKIVMLALVMGMVGCQGMSGPFSSKKKERSTSGSDPLYSSDLEEQQKWGRSRYSYPEDDRGIAPPGYAGRPTPSGR